MPGVIVVKIRNRSRGDSDINFSPATCHNPAIPNGPSAML